MSATNVCTPLGRRGGSTDIVMPYWIFGWFTGLLFVRSVNKKEQEEALANIKKMAEEL